MGLLFLTFTFLAKEWGDRDSYNSGITTCFILGLGFSFQASVSIGLLSPMGSWISGKGLDYIALKSGTCTCVSTILSSITGMKDSEGGISGG